MNSLIRRVGQAAPLRWTAPIKYARFSSAISSTSDKQKPPRVLITGATGQIGMELISYLRVRYGADNVVATDVKFEPEELHGTGPYQYLDVTDEDGRVQSCSISHCLT